MGGVQNSGNGIMGFVVFVLSSASFFVWAEILPHRQCWEQERTTCSGGYPSATCSAFLRTTVRGCDNNSIVGISGIVGCFTIVYGYAMLLCSIGSVYYIIL